MTWTDNLHASSTEDGFIIADGAEAELVPRNIHWHDNYMHSFTEDGVKIANLKKAITRVDVLPETADLDVFYLLSTNGKIYYYDGKWNTLGEGGTVELDLEGESGTLTEAEIALVESSAEVILVNDGEMFYLANKSADLTYRTYINTDAAVGEDLSAKAIYIQLNPSAVNYGHWSLEDVDFPGGGPAVAQTTGTSTTNVMSQKAVTDMVFPNNNPCHLNIGSGTTTAGLSDGYISITPLDNGAGINTGQNSVSIVPRTFSLKGARGSHCIAIGLAAGAGNSEETSSNTAIGSGAEAGFTSSYASAYGAGAKADQAGSVAIGAFSMTIAPGEMNIGSNLPSYGYNNTNYRLITGVHDGINQHDAFTVGQANALIDAINAAMNTSIQHIGIIPDEPVPDEPVGESSGEELEPAPVPENI